MEPTINKRQKPKNKKVGGFFIIVRKNYLQKMMIHVLYRNFCVRTKEEHIVVWSGVVGVFDS